MHKVDRWLIPWLCLLYLLSFLDRTNIGNARVAGIEEDLGMEGHDYNNTLTIFVSESPGPTTTSSADSETPVSSSPMPLQSQ